jgi:hypothetical protein
VRGVTELAALRVLKLSGGPTPSVECMEALSRLRRLQELEVLPGDYGVLHGDVLPPNEAAGGARLVALLDGRLSGGSSRCFKSSECKSSSRETQQSVS